MQEFIVLILALAKENRAAEMGRFGRPFRKASDLLLGFFRLCATIYAPRGYFRQLFSADDQYSFALSLGKKVCHRAAQHLMTVTMTR